MQVDRKHSWLVIEWIDESTRLRESPLECKYDGRVQVGEKEKEK